MAREQISPTRMEILTTLKMRGGMTVEDLGERLGVTGMTVRYHLTSLRAAGLVQSHTERRGVGRPVEVYSLTEAAEEFFPRRYDALAVDILQQLEESGGESRVREVFERGQSRLFQANAARLEGKSFEEKVAEVARILDENGYLADWQQDGDSFRITEHNCALDSVARHYAHPCLSEMKLIEEFLGAEVTREHHRRDGHHCCTYVIRERKQGADEKPAERGSEAA